MLKGCSKRLLQTGYRQFKLRGEIVEIMGLGNEPGILLARKDVSD
jgi:hypothetical protein